MADEQKVEAEAPEAPPVEKKGRKKSLFLGGGLLAVLAVAYLSAVMAVPKKSVERVFEGPFVAPLFPERISVNLKGQGGKRFLIMGLNVEFDAYDSAFVAARTADPLYQAMLKDALIDVASRKTVEEATDPIEKELLLDEVRQQAEPLLFPLQIGTGSPEKEDPKSGLRPGASSGKGSMRGALDDHVLHVSTTEGTLRLDDGPPVKYRGGETDLMLSDAAGKTVFVDTTRIREHFDGECRVGVSGRVRNIYLDSYLIQ